MLRIDYHSKYEILTEILDPIWAKYSSDVTMKLHVLRKVMLQEIGSFKFHD